MSTSISTSRMCRTGLRRPATALATAAGAAALCLATPLAAQAHVSVSTDSTAAGSYALLTLSVPHGCEGSPTTRLTVRVPQGINSVTPTVHPGWTVTKRSQKLAKPVTDAHGRTLTTRVSEVVWTARTPLAEGYRDALSLQVPLPEEAAGQQLAFPTVQTCTRGATEWTQVPAAGQDAHELEHPAPTVTVTAAESAQVHQAGSAVAGQQGGHDSAAGTVGVQATLPAPVATAPAGGAALGVAGLALGALGLLAGVTALLRTRAGARPVRS